MKTRYLKTDEGTVDASLGPTIVHSAVAVAMALAVGCAGSYDPQAEFWPSLPDAGSTTATTGGTGGIGGSISTGEAGGGAGAGGNAGTAGSLDNGGSLGTGGIQEGAGGGESTKDAGARDAGGRDGGAPTDAATTLPTGACLSVTVTTATDNGRYSPRNIGAIWIAGPTGTFVKTLAEWGRQRVSHLNAWNSATSQAGLSGNTVDAVTGATLSSHQTHMVSWNCADTKGKIVPDGSYAVHFEMTDQNSAGPTTTVQFTKGPSPVNLSPADQSNFKRMTVVYTP